MDNHSALCWAAALFPSVSLLEKEDAVFCCLVLQTLVTRVSAHLN